MQVISSHKPFSIVVGLTLIGRLVYVVEKAQIRSSCAYQIRSLCASSLVVILRTTSLNCTREQFLKAIGGTSASLTRQGTRAIPTSCQRYKKYYERCESNSEILREVRGRFFEVTRDTRVIPGIRV